MHLNCIVSVCVQNESSIVLYAWRNDKGLSVHNTRGSKEVNFFKVQY